MLSKCLLCERNLKPIPGTNRQLHPDAPDCEVRVTNSWGIAVDEDPDTLVRLVERALNAQADVDDEPSLAPTYTLVDTGLSEIFKQRGIPRLGGASSGRGWSSFSTFQACPYKWSRRYLGNTTDAAAVQASPSWFFTENPYMAIGSIAHALLAVYYANMRPGLYAAEIQPEEIRAELLELGCNPELVNEAWRLFVAYRLYYQFEVIEPLAVELDLKDPRTKESCRYDMIAFFPDEAPMRLPGTWVIEHKTKSRFDQAALESWPNDGEILGQVMLWKRLGLDKRFGSLQGVIVNIIGRQKEPKFHRAIVAPSAWQIEQHAKDLSRWEGLMQLAIQYNSFPRARNSCATYGLCENFEHCASGE